MQHITYYKIHSTMKDRGYVFAGYNNECNTYGMYHIGNPGDNHSHDTTHETGKCSQDVT